MAKGRPWTTWEQQILKQNFSPTISLASLAELLPGRTVSSISHKVQELGLPTRIKRWTESEDRILTENYLFQEPSVLIKLLPSRSIGSIKAKAKELGLCRAFRRRKWEPEERQLIEDLAGVQPCSRILQKLNQLCKEKGWTQRTRYSLRIYIYRLGLSAAVEEDGDYYNLTQLQDALHCSKTVVLRWIKTPEFAKILKPVENGPAVLIRRDHLAKFFKAYPGEVARTRPDIIWLISVLD